MTPVGYGRNWASANSGDNERVMSNRFDPNSQAGHSGSSAYPRFELASADSCVLTIKTVPAFPARGREKADVPAKGALMPIDIGSVQRVSTSSGDAGCWGFNIKDITGRRWLMIKYRTAEQAIAARERIIFATTEAVEATVFPGQ
jgi:hypothetical protein